MLFEAFNFEYRAADAAASPYLALGALVWAGLDGLRAGRAVREANRLGMLINVSHASRLILLSFLSPTLVRQILEGARRLTSASNI